MIQKPEDCIEYWVSKLGRAMNNISDKELQKYDLTSSQSAVLYQLWAEDGLTQKEIQERLNLRAASVSGLVDTLLMKKFIYREQDNKDCRCKRLYLTEDAKHIYNQIIKIRNEMEDLTCKGFLEYEKSILISSLQKAYSNLKNEIQ